MKSLYLACRLFLIAIITVLCTNCDDGKLEVKSINFTSVLVQSCSTNNLLYKNNGTELLILDIPLTKFANDETMANNPIVVNLSSTERVIYRSYNGSVGSANICPTLPSTTPQVQQEWVATNGVVLITSTAIKTFDNNTNATRITGYKHNIVFRNLTWDTPNGQVVWAYDYTYGDYQTNVTKPSFNFGLTLTTIPCSVQRIFACNVSESIELNLATPATAFASSVTAAGAPRIIVLDDANKVIYRNYINGLISPSYYCAATLPSSPTLNESWIALNGESTISGWIEVETTTSGPDFLHTVTLCKMKFQKGNSTFYLADRFLLGTLLTN